MNPFLSSNSDDDKKVKFSQVLGGTMGWFENEGSYETEAAVSSVVRGTGGVLEEEKARFPSKGTLEFSKNQAKAEAENKKIFYQALKEDQARTQQAKDKMWLEEEINDITSNMSTEEKNRLLHYQKLFEFVLSFWDVQKFEHQ